MRKMCFVFLFALVVTISGCAWMADHVQPISPATQEAIASSAGQAAQTNIPKPFSGGAEGEAAGVVYAGIGYLVAKGGLRLLNGAIVAFKEKYGTKKA